MRFAVFSDSGASASGGRRLRFAGNPLALAVALLVAIALALFPFVLVKMTWDNYVAYEGTVLRIETRWYDHVVFEFVDSEHLVVETPAGVTIDRYVGDVTRVANNIKVGVYVVKERGFGRPPRPRDGKTVDEMLKGSQRALEGAKQ